MEKLATEFYAPQYTPQNKFQLRKPVEMYYVDNNNIKQSKNPNSLTCREF